MNSPARLQVDPNTLPDDKPPQSGNVFNVWYLRWSGGDGSKQIVKLKFRVNIKKDSGYTKANKSKGKTSTICLYFSKGCCYRGANCQYLHRLPDKTDYYPPTQDCFGRDKTATHNDDMNGVGVLNKINNTLYIGGLHIANVSKKHQGDHTESILSKHFGEFGRIVKIKLLPTRNCGFITFKEEFEAQFAKEAMQNQSLDDNEVLMVRWANDDPDPNSQKQAQKHLESVTMETVRNLLKRQREEEVDSEEADSEEADADNVKGTKSHEPEIQEPEIEEPEEESPSSTNDHPKLLLNSMFNKHSLDVLSSISSSKKRKANPLKSQPMPSKTVLDMLAYSSDED